jgi:FHA domain
VTNEAEAGDATPDVLELDVISGRAEGFSLVVSDRLVVGRNSRGPGRLADDPQLSRDHAEIARGPSGEFAITDLSSTNGTFVNGVRLHAPAILRVGDEIEIGTTKMRVRSAPSAMRSAVDVDIRATTMIVDAPSARHESGAALSPGTELQPVVGDQPVRVSLTLDLEQKAAQLSLHGRDETITLVLDDGYWRLGSGGL